MASFSNKVKEELCSVITDRDKKYACLYGILLYCRNFTKEHIQIQSESSHFVMLFDDLIKSVFGKEVKPKIEKGMKNNGTEFFTISISNCHEIALILQTYDIRLSRREIKLAHIVNNSINVFLSGVFFVCGSISDPYKEYHLEFSAPEEQLYLDLHDILLSFGVDAGMTVRKNAYVLYIKDSENIEDILASIGARQCTIDLMNIKIYKDVRNKANRIANCDSANIDKVVAAAERQIGDIELIQKFEKFDSLSSDLKEVSLIRIENPEFSLQEIGEMLKKPIGRSGVNRRFRKIAEIADELRKQ